MIFKRTIKNPPINCFPPLAAAAEPIFRSFKVIFPYII